MSVFALFFSTLIAFAQPAPDKISLFLYKAPTAIDWRSPGQMARTAIWNTLSGHPNPLSHLDVLLECEGQPRIVTGMGRVRSLAHNLSILWNNPGLKMLTDSYPGRLIEEKEIMAYLPQARKSGELKTLTYLISKPTCERLSRFFNEYRERGYAKTYSGFLSNPFRGEGAGCAAYGIAFLKVAGLLDEESVTHWTRKIRVPERLMANGFWGFMLGRNDSWAAQDEPAISLTIFDPEKMHAWIGNRHELVVDRRSVPTPLDDYWNY